VLGADRRPADDEQVAARVDDGLPVLLRPLLSAAATVTPACRISRSRSAMSSGLMSSA
jgi:hypothetical protein